MLFCVCIFWSNLKDRKRSKLTRHPSTSPLRRHHRGRGKEGAVGGVKRHPVRRWNWRWEEGRGVRRPGEVKTFKDALAHLLHFGNQFSLKSQKQHNTLYFNTVYIFT